MLIGGADAESLDHMISTVKGAGEGGDRGICYSGHVDVGYQVEGDAAEIAALTQLGELLQTGGSGNLECLGTAIVLV